MTTRGRRAWTTVPAICLIPFLSLLGDNGDLVDVSEVLAETPLADVTQDLRDGSYWVLGASGISLNSHRIHHLSNDLDRDLGFIENPHPPGTIPNITTNRGIAFRSLGGLRTLFVLSRVRTGDPLGWVVRETDPDSIDDAGFTGAVFAVTPPDSDASLYGLAYDVIAREFWTLDTQNDKAIRFDTQGAVTLSFTLPGKETSGTRIPGQGIAYELEIVDGQPVSLVYSTFGDIFRLEPAKVIQMALGEIDGSPAGLRTGADVPLTEIPAVGLGGFHMSRIGAQRRLVMVAATGEVFQLEVSVSEPVPPSGLTCSLTLSSEVSLSWKNHGSGLDGSYGGVIQVLRNGVPFATVSGNIANFIDLTPVEGTSTYSLRATDSAGGPSSAPSCECEVTVGPGGLTDWASMPGATAFDVAADPVRGEVFVTDNQQSRIFVLDGDLELVGEVPWRWSDSPGGIAYIPSIRLGFPVPVEFNDLLAVADASGKKVRLIDRQGNEKTTISLAIADQSPRIGSLTYLPESQRLAGIVRAQGGLGAVMVFDSNGSLARACDPPFLLGLEFDRGITYDPLRGSFLCTFEAGVIHELFNGPGCPANNDNDFPPIELVSLGDGYADPAFVGGIAIDKNTLLVTGPKANAVYRILIFPFENTFIRGDVDASGSVNVTDVVSIARYLFQGGSAPGCLDAADANDDGFIDIADPVYVLFFSFVGGPPPPDPFPAQGRDPTFRDNLGCGAGTGN